MSFLFQTNVISIRDLQLIAPELILTVTACVALVMEVILPYKLSKWTAHFSLAGIALALISLGAQFGSMNGTFKLSALQNLTAIDGFYGMIRIDGFALVFKAIFLIAAALAILIAMRYLDIEREQHGEYYALVCTSCWAPFPQAFCSTACLCFIALRGRRISATLDAASARRPRARQCGRCCCWE